MDDFNSDNAKIDAAIQSAKSENHVCKILEITTTSAAQQIDADVSSINFLLYHHVWMFIHTTLANNSVYVLLNNSTGNVYFSYGDSSDSGSVTGSSSLSDGLAGWRNVSGIPQDITLDLGTPNQGGVACRLDHISINSAGNYERSFKQCVSTSATWPTLQTFNLAAYQATLPVGTQILIYGVKK